MFCLCVPFVVVLPDPGGFFCFGNMVYSLSAGCFVGAGLLELLVLIFGGMYLFSKPSLFASASFGVSLFAVLIVVGFPVFIHFEG